MPKKSTIDFEKADKEVLTYLELLLEKKGMGGMPSNILADMIMDLYGRFDHFLTLSVMQKMNPDAYKQFDGLLESDPTPEKTMEFMEKHVPNLQEVIKEAMEEFEKIYLSEPQIRT